MAYLVLGLVIFLGVHSVRMVAEGWRTRTMARVGEGAYKGLYSVVSLLSFGLIVYGFGLARQQPVQLWSLPFGMKHVASTLMLVSLVLLTAAYVPGNQIKARLHHPMVLSVKTWALAHLLANGNLAHVVLFGAFLAWAVWNFVAARKRDQAGGVTYPAGMAGATMLTVVVGLAAWALLAFWLHGWLIGVRPLG
jgi:uncharacterized membrane protein